MDAWWAYVVVTIGLVGSFEGREVVLVVSRRQFARPAVELRVLLQISWTPPVEALREAICPEVIFWSSSVRKASARACLRAAKSFAAWRSARVRLVGLEVWDFLGEDVGDVLSDLASGRKGFFLGDLIVLRGECLSFQSFTWLGLQKPSRLCRRGGVGILVFGFEGDTRRDFVGEAGGGVVGRSGVSSLDLVASRGGEKRRNASRTSFSCELVGRSSERGLDGAGDVGSCIFAGLIFAGFVSCGFAFAGFVSSGFFSLMLRPWNPCNASSRLVDVAFGAAVLSLFPGHNFRTLGSSSSDCDPEVPESEPHHTLSSMSASSC